ncbi:MAG: phosphate ABC transporter ATP-binding protein PstB [Firmicutes bacterium]|nr:phosphate ABC transporter ATP-binding protein PstB [Bacillota bacterium]MCL5040470.1 phosphate ABC transporter ATP-binding protein PstB [Bacillota bacterium]
MAQGMEIRNLSAWYGSQQVLKEINLPVSPNQVTAIIGPSGCGKSTFVRTLNRLHEIIPGARVSGQVFLGEVDLYAPGVDPVSIRRRIGMVFQKPNPFPTMSIFENAAAGLRLNGVDKRRLAEQVEKSLKLAALWDEVSNRLGQSGAALSGGQQQRLCLARALAVSPEILLMDEPASALDPAATLKIEDLIRELKKEYTIIVVTHNMQQAARVADQTAFFLNGELVEYGPSSEIFTRPKDRRTEDYITGRFG